MCSSVHVTLEVGYLISKIGENVILKETPVHSATSSLESYIQDEVAFYVNTDKQIGVRVYRAKALGDRI